MLLALIVAAGLIGGAKGWGLWRELQYLRAYVDGLPAELDDQASAYTPGQPPYLEPIPLAGAGGALAKPPADFRLVLDALRAKGPGRYRFPLGWCATEQGGWLQTAQLSGDVNHILLSGQSDSGKDIAALNMLLALAATHSPEQLQVAIIDGKGLDWAGWQNKAHCWRLATEPEEIKPGMDALSSERQRRRSVLKAAGASKWENYKGGDMPLLVIFVSELLLLQSATSKTDLTNWLEIELTSARACGMRYIIATQTATGFSNQWRSQISLFLAGYQPNRHADEPNTGMGTGDIEQAEAVPPSKLPAGVGGVFVAIQGATAINLRTSLISDEQRDYLLAQLPTATPKALQPAPARPAAVQPASQPMSIDDQHRAMLTALLVAEGSLADGAASEPVSSTRYSPLERPEAAAIEKVAPGSGSAVSRSGHNLEPLPVALDLVPADEQRQILELAKRVSSRRALCQQLYSGATGGAAYKKVQQVCDAAGLLMPSQAVAA